MYLLDTNVISELRRNKPGQSYAVRRWASTVPPQHQFLSVITLLELERGILSLERKDKAQGLVLRSWFEAIVGEFQSRLLVFGPVTSSLCAKLHVPNPMPEMDAMLAATAKEHGMIIVTRNTADFARTGVPLINPWEA